jgi:hypothetical protein
MVLLLWISIMFEFCEKFKGGYCERARMHVPKSWCVNRCKGNPAERPDVPKVKPAPPTIMQMAEHFGKSMVRWADSGFEFITKNDYLIRRCICETCAGGFRCPDCGCLIWAKAALKSEICKRGKWLV